MINLTYITGRTHCTIAAMPNKSHSFASTSKFAHFQCNLSHHWNWPKHTAATSDRFPPQAAADFCQSRIALIGFHYVELVPHFHLILFTSIISYKRQLLTNWDNNKRGYCLG